MWHQLHKQRNFSKKKEKKMIHSSKQRKERERETKREFHKDKIDYYGEIKRKIPHPQTIEWIKSQSSKF